MALEDVHLDVLQNIEFAIISVYRQQHTLRDLDVMRALDALIDVYRAEARGHTPKDIQLEEPENTVFQHAKQMCEYRLGRQDAAMRIHTPFEGDKTTSDVLACLRKLRKSVDRWNKRNGERGYLQFVKDYV